MSLIEPIVLKGFRDSLPEQEIPKKKIMRALEDEFQSFGFVPIDTPALEYTSVLLGKGGGETDKQIFHFTDNGGREVALRFDLTVPFARFLAAHSSLLALPFKRYHINKVWRGENPQKGRYREFIQCDFDIVGADNAESDFEILSLMDASFRMLQVGGYEIHVAHRGLFNAFLDFNGIRDKSIDILRCVDKLRKIGEEAVLEQLSQITGSRETAGKILEYIDRPENESFEEGIARLEGLAGGENEASRRLREILALIRACGIEEHFMLDPSITRGLDYYTGIVYETFLTECPQIGSVCSGGRYNDLAGLYTKEHLPGVGSSIGLDRLLAALEELKSPLLADSASADLVILHRPGEEALAMKSAAALRARGVKVDVYLTPEKKAKQQYDYAARNRIQFSLSFTAEGAYSLKNLETREVTVTSSVDDICSQIGR
ncbi:MAG: histidine--tRNA ligase [Spirochaetales bacterium]|nr:histidine--tRNA ligase [Spirochaetales bacterium]